ncbi:MAG TPA: choice-of-anchor tandem repeat GloVer-containing protein [Terriglobia bacterium]|nr:choice-of-anchor tandem repeat GloVer-containing protein [Terriglobia bacterium]
MPSGTLATLYSFGSQSGCADGSSPAAALVQDTNGDFYGTTYSGAANGDGRVYSLSVGVGACEKNTDRRQGGRSVILLGTNLTRATSVTFNGTPAVFKVISSSEIGAIIPAGAITGPVQVVTR